MVTAVGQKKAEYVQSKLFTLCKSTASDAAAAAAAAGAASAGSVCPGEFKEYFRYVFTLSYQDNPDYRCYNVFIKFAKQLINIILKLYQNTFEQIFQKKNRHCIKLN
jgi:hypothetical protein